MFCVRIVLLNINIRNKKSSIVSICELLYINRIPNIVFYMNNKHEWIKSTDLCNINIIGKFWRRSIQNIHKVFSLTRIANTPLQGLVIYILVSELGTLSDGFLIAIAL